MIAWAAFKLLVGGWLSKIKLFFTTPLGRALLIGIAFILYSLSLHSCGVHGERAKWKAKEKAEAAASKLAVQSGRAISESARSTNDQQQKAIAANTADLAKQVPAYVPATVNCRVNRGFVSLYNRAAAGPVSSTSSGPEQPSTNSEAAAPSDLLADSEISLADVATNDIYNFGVAKSLRSEVVTWRDWYRAEAATYGQPPAPPH